VPKFTLPKYGQAHKFWYSFGRFPKKGMTQIGNVQLAHILAVCANPFLWYLYFGIKPIDCQNFSYHILAPNQLLSLPII
jgi:hypothetical protein